MVQKQDNKGKSTTAPKTEVQKQAEKISWVVAVIIIIISIFIAIVCTVIYSKQPSLPIEYDYVIENWKKEPIINITPLSNGCTEFLTTFDFPGTVEGCNCKNSQSALFKDQIIVGSCSTEQTQSGCQNVLSTASKQFTQWRLQNQILQLCVHRATGFNYMNSDCSQKGYVRCGVAKGDTTSPNQFCMPSKADCPINSIIYGAAPPDDTYKSIIDVGPYRLYSSIKSTTNLPIAYTRVARGNGECKDFDNYHYIGNNMSEYELMRGKDNTCTQEETDARFKQLFQIGEADYLEVNDYKDDVNKLPGYPLDKNMQYYLLTREYIPWKQLDDCRYTHMPYFIDLKSKTELVNELWVGCIIVNWFVAVLYGFVANTLRLKMNWKIKNWYIIPTAFLLFIQMLITIITFSFTTDINKNIKDVSDAKCSDDSTNSFITKYSDDYSKSVLNYQIVLLVFVIVLVIFTLFFMKQSDKVETIVPSSDIENKNEDDQNLNNEMQKQNQYDENGQPIGNNGQSTGLFLHNNNEGTTQDMYSNLNNNGNTRNSQQETVNIPLVVNASYDPESMKKGVLKKGNQQNSNQKSTKFDDEYERNKDTENLYASGGNSGLRNNSNLKNSQNKNHHTGRTMESIHEEDLNGRLKFQTEKNGRSRNDLQLNINQSSGNKSYNNLNSANKNPNYSQLSQQEFRVKSLAQLDDLEDHNDWEFDIEGYVKKHRENQQTSNRIGGGYEIPKPKEKYDAQKYKSQSKIKIKTQNSIDQNDIEKISPEKFKMLDRKGTLNILSPERTQNNIESNAELDQQLHVNTVQNQSGQQQSPNQANYEHQDIEVTKLS